MHIKYRLSYAPSFIIHGIVIIVVLDAVKCVCIRQHDEGIERRATHLVWYYILLSLCTFNEKRSTITFFSPVAVLVQVLFVHVKQLTLASCVQHMHRATEEEMAALCCCVFVCVCACVGAREKVEVCEILFHMLGLWVWLKDVNIVVDSRGRIYMRDNVDDDTRSQHSETWTGCAFWNYREEILKLVSTITTTIATVIVIIILTNLNTIRFLLNTLQRISISLAQTESDLSKLPFRLYRSQSGTHKRNSLILSVSPSLPLSLSFIWPARSFICLLVILAPLFIHICESNDKNVHINAFDLIWIWKITDSIMIYRIGWRHRWHPSLNSLLK